MVPPAPQKKSTARNFGRRLGARRDKLLAAERVDVLLDDARAALAKRAAEDFRLANFFVIRLPTSLE